MQNQLKISSRLKQIASYLHEGTFFADIGSDHAYLPCYVCLQDSHARAIAGEVKKGPFNSANETVKRFNLQHAVDVRLGNGLAVLTEKDDVKQIVIAGMGGALITSILEEGQGKLAPIKRLVLQPNTNAEAVRIWLLNHDFTIIEETIVEEHGHLYEIIVADSKIKSSPYDPNQLQKQLMFGPYLLKKKQKEFYQKWKAELKKTRHVLQQMEQGTIKDEEKIIRFEQRIKWIQEVLNDESTDEC